jgi:hypothetical protein
MDIYFRWSQIKNVQFVVIKIQSFSTPCLITGFLTRIAEGTISEAGTAYPSGTSEMLVGIALINL